MNPITQGMSYSQHDAHERRLWRGAGGRSDFRVSLSRTSAAPSADQTAKTLAYLVPVGRGLILDLFDGEDWVPRKIQYDPDQTNTRAVLTADLSVMTTTTVPHDLFVRWRAGKPETKMVAWGSATARNGASISAPWLHESGLGMHDGVLVRSDGNAKAAAAGRIDPFWRHLATLYPSASGQCEDSVANRFVWNMYNRAPRPFGVSETNTSWTFSTAGTYRQVRASSANQVGFVCGVSGDSVWAFAHNICVNSSGGCSAEAGIGLDSTTVNSARGGAIYPTNVTIPAGSCLYTGVPSIGYHYLAWLEGAGSDCSTTITWYGSSNLPTGMAGEILA
jgi:hypothetical protein